MRVCVYITHTYYVKLHFILDVINQLDSTILNL